MAKKKSSSAAGDIPWVDAGGEKRLLAGFHDGRTKNYCTAEFAAKYPVIPESDWTEVDLTETFDQVYVKDQGQHGSCVGHQYYATFSYAWLQGGNKYHDFSPCFMYGLINGGRDQGAYTGDSLKAGAQYGICLESEVPEGMIYQSQFPAQAFETAKRFKNMESYFTPSFEQIMSALELRHPVGIGIEIGQRFDPDGDGFMPDLRGRLGGHDITVVGKRKSKGIWWAKIQNSWTKSWGVNGFAYLNASYFPGGGEADNFCLVANVLDPQDPVPTPIP